MKQSILYRYLGTNGTIETPIHLEDIYYVKVIHLQADEGMVLTNGSITTSSARVSEDEIPNWREIPEGQD